MLILEVVELAAVVLGMVGTGVFLVTKAERVYQLCKVGIRSKKTMTLRIASDLHPVRFAEIARQQKIAAQRF